MISRRIADRPAVEEQDRQRAAPRRAPGADQVVGAEHPPAVRDALVVERPADLLAEVRERDVPQQRRVHGVVQVSAWHPAGPDANGAFGQPSRVRTHGDRDALRPRRVSDDDRTTTTTTTTTSTSTTTMPGSACAAFPLAGCRLPVEPGKAKLVMKDRLTDDDGDAVTWKYVKGAATTLEELGDPTSATSYVACLYDGAGERLMTLRAPAGGTCGASPVLEGQGDQGLHVFGQGAHARRRAQARTRVRARGEDEDRPLRQGCRYSTAGARRVHAAAARPAAGQRPRAGRRSTGRHTRTRRSASRRWPTKPCSATTTILAPAPRLR